MRLPNPAAKAQTEEASRHHVPEEPVSSQLVILGKHSVPHVFLDGEGRAWVRITGRGVTLDLSMTPGQLRSIQGQSERVLLAHDLKPVGGAA